MSDPKHACVDCLFFTSSRGVQCDKPEYRDFNPVYGWRGIKAKDARSISGLCGPEAKGWVKREPPPKIGWWVSLFVGLPLAWWVLKNAGVL
jgi:hypothetical protein